MRWCLPIAVVLAGVWALPREGALAPERRPPTFGAEVEVVNLNVSVTDGLGQYVTDLKSSDFAVFEDGVRQDLSIFSHDDLPISLVLMIDGSASMTPKVRDARMAAGRFLKTLRPEDQAQVVQFNDRTTILQEFTSDQKALEEAIAHTEATGPTALHNALYVSLKELAREKKRPAAPRRRAIILLSDGEDTASLVSDAQVIELAKQTEISIYTILLRSREHESDRPAFSQASYLLNTLAQESGGRAFLPNSMTELDTVYDRIAAELRTLYSLGYISNNSRHDGKWRRIVLRVTTRENLQVRHKIGYYGVPR